MSPQYQDPLTGKTWWEPAKTPDVSKCRTLTSDEIRREQSRLKELQQAEQVLRENLANLPGGQGHLSAAESFIAHPVRRPTRVIDITTGEIG